MSELTAASAAKQLSDAGHAAAIEQAKQTEQGLMQATMQVSRQAQMHIAALNQRSSQHAAIAARNHSQSLTESRQETERALQAQTEQMALMNQQHQIQLGQRDRLNTLHGRFNELHTAIVADPSTLQTLQHMRTQAAMYSDDRYIQDKLASAEALR